MTSNELFGKIPYPIGPARTQKSPFIWFIILALLGLASFANASEIITNPTYTGPKTTIRYSLWGGADEVQETKTICNWFVLDHPQIQVDISIYPWGEYWTKVQTEMASGIAPDVMSFYSGSFGVWAQRGALLPLTKLLKSDHFSTSGFFPAAINNCSWNNQLYCMPSDIAIWCLVYSKDRLEERGIPRSEWPQPNKPMPWRQFVELSRKLTLRNPNGTFQQYGMTAGQNWETVMASMDGGFFTDHQVHPSQPTIIGNDKLYRGLLQLFESEYADRSTLGATPLATDSSINNTDTILTSSRFAMGTTGPWALPQLEQAGVRFGVSPMPMGEEPINLINVNSVGISSSTKHPRSSLKLIEFLASQRVQNLFASKLKGVPVLKSAVPSFIHNDYHIKDCEAYVYDTLNAKSAITTDNNQLNTDFTNFFTDLGQSLDNSYDSELAKLPKENGAISSSDYAGFEKRMKRNVASILQSKLTNLNEEMKLDFEQANMPASTIEQKLFAPAGLFFICVVFVFGYLRFVRTQQTSTNSSGMKVKNKTGFAFLSPWLFGLTFFTMGPLIAALLLSFTHWNMVQPPQWIGILHYQRLGQDQNFWMGIKKTFLYAALVIPISLGGGLLTAGLLATKIRGADLFKAIIYLPSLFTGAEAAVLWVHMLNKDHGILNSMLSWIHIAPVNWLDADHAFYSVVMMNLFWIGGAMIIYYAGMKQIPATLYEAADLDGASAARKFLQITIPLLSPVILFLVIITTIGAFQVFTPALFFASSSNTIGDPDNSLRFYAVNIYDAAFNKLEMGTACTYAVILFFIIFLVTMVQMKLAKRFVYTESGS